VWRARRYIGAMKYLEATLSVADDETDADGVKVLNYRDALKAAREWWQREERRASGVPDQREGPYTVSNALDDYLGHYARKGGKAEGKVRTGVEVHIRPKLGSLAVDKLSTRRIRDWHHGLATAPRRLRTRPGMEQKFAPAGHDVDAVRARRATANRVLTVLKAALNHAYAERNAASADSWNAVKPFREVDAPRIRFLAPDECRRLVNACEPDFRQLVRGALLTGMRYGELTRLRVGDVHLDAGSLMVARSKAGKARTVALSDEGLDLLRDLTAGRPRTALVFTHEDGRAWGASHQLRPITGASARARLDVPATFHILRHIYGSLLAMRGVPMGVIAAQLGHAKTRMTERHYAHLAPSYVAETVRANLPALGITDRANLDEMQKSGSLYRVA
jgi:integrase